MTAPVDEEPLKVAASLLRDKSCDWIALESSEPLTERVEISGLQDTKHIQTVLRHPASRRCLALSQLMQFRNKERP